jgi:hypothetical protein
MAAIDSESSEGSGLAQPGSGSAHGLCDLCKVPVAASSTSSTTRFGFRNLHKACYNALQALARVAKGKGDMAIEKDVADTLREDPERFRAMALALRTERSRSRTMTSLKDVKEYIKTMAATRTISRNKKAIVTHQEAVGVLAAA